MTWLLTQMWAVLAIAGLLGLLFGLGLRGAMLRGKMRRAEVERGLYATELEQARTEIEGLYAAQRKFGAASANPEIEAELNRRIAGLERELAEARASTPAPAAPTPIGGGTTAAPAEDTSTLEWRNRYLESRVRSLEARLEAADSVEATGAPSTAEPVAAGAPTAPEESVDAAKLAWQNDYLRMRLRAFESEAGLAPSDVPESPDTNGPVAPAPAPAPTPLPAVDDGRETPDEELARLRWRNRYLEGRLAYLEEERSKDAAPQASPEAGPAAAAQSAPAFQDAAPAVETATSPLPEAPDTSQVDITEPETAQVGVEPFNPETAPPAEAVQATEAEPVAEPIDPTPAEPAEPAFFIGDEIAAAFDTRTIDTDEAAAPAEPVRPDALNAPRNGQADDLTAIEGIGPRIQEVLNSIGIYHLDQIASWNAGNVAWIDKFLAFDGRVARENWVGQAHRLMSASAMNLA